MNVAYNQINVQDAAKMLGVDKTTVAGWCRKNFINFINVGDGNRRGRYMIPEKEIQHIKDLIKEYGSLRKALPHYKKDWEDVITNEKYPTVPAIKSVITNITVEDSAPVKKRFDVDNIVTTISYIQDIKERLNDIEAEKNQLTAELEELRKEVMEYL